MLKVISIDESKLWDEIVKSFANYDIYYLSGYVKAFQIHGDGTPLLIFYEKHKFRALNVVMKRDIADEPYFKERIQNDTYYDLSTPYGYGGFIIDGPLTKSEVEDLNSSYLIWCIDNNIVSEFVRFHPIIENSKQMNGIYQVIDLGKTITMNLNSKEQIWDDLTSKNRNVIRKSIKSGVEIFWGRVPKLIDEFIPMYNGTMDKDEATDYYYFDREFYQSVIHDIKHNSLFFYAVYEGQIISMSLMLFANNNMHYHLSASLKEFQSLASTNLLLYEAACWGCENGYRKFHLGGGLGSKEDGLFKFKKSFNKESKTYFSIGRRMFDSVKYDELVKMKGISDDIAHTKFFPLYRAKQ